MAAIAAAARRRRGWARSVAAPAARAAPAAAAAAANRGVLRAILWRSTQAVGGLAALTTVLYQTGALEAIDEGSARSVRFWSAAFPIYLRYEFVQQRNKRGLLADDAAMEKYEALHDRYAPFVRDLTYEMRGFYLKNAQLMSTRDEFVPPQYMAWCKETQDNCPTEFGPGEARAMAARELGRPLDEVFERWDDEPLAVASIGEVHSARLTAAAAAELRAAGEALEDREVVVKIQLPDIERRFRSVPSPLPPYPPCPQPPTDTRVIVGV